MAEVPAPLVTKVLVAIPVPITSHPLILALVLAVIVTVATPAPPPLEYVLVTAVVGPHGLNVITPEGVPACVGMVNVTVPAPLVTRVPGVILVPVTYHPLILLGVARVKVIEVVVADETLSLKSLLASDKLLVPRAVK